MKIWCPDLWTNGAHPIQGTFYQIRAGIVKSYGVGAQGLFITLSWLGRSGPKNEVYGIPRLPAQCTQPRRDAPRPKATQDTQRHIA